MAHEFRVTEVRLNYSIIQTHLPIWQEDTRILCRFVRSGTTCVFVALHLDEETHYFFMEIVPEI